METISRPAVIGLTFLLGCTMPCFTPPTLISQRQPASGVHLRLTLPLELANRLLGDQLPQLAEQRLTVPSLGGLMPRALSELRARVRGARLLPARLAGALLRVEIAIKRGDELLVTLHCDLRLQPNVESRRLELAPRPADLARVEPRIGPNARTQIANLLRRQLPARLGRWLPPARLERATDTLIRYLGVQGFDLLRRGLLMRLGRLTALTFDLPDLPLAGATLRSARAPRPHLVVDLRTTLPVRQALAPAPTVVSELAQVEISGSTVAELANHAMRRGALPRRYDGRFKPAAEGDRFPRYDWIAADRRPLKIVVTKTSSPCVRAHLGARARVEVASAGEGEGEDGAEKLRLGVEDGALERIEGSPLIRFGAWFRRLWARPIAFSKRIAARFRVAVGGRNLTLGVRSAAVHPDRIAVGLHLTFEVSAPRRADPEKPLPPLD